MKPSRRQAFGIGNDPVLGQSGDVDGTPSRHGIVPDPAAESVGAWHRVISGGRIMEDLRSPIAELSSAELIEAWVGVSDPRANFRDH